MRECYAGWMVEAKAVGPTDARRAKTVDTLQQEMTSEFAPVGFASGMKRPQNRVRIASTG